MAVFAPGDDPRMQDPGLWARLMGYVGGLSPIGPAAADTLNQAPNPLTNPTPVPAALSGGGPSVPLGLFGGGQPPAPMPEGAPVPPIPVTSAGPSILPQARGRAVLPDPLSVQRGFPAPSGYGPETTHMPYPGQTDPNGVFAPRPVIGHQPSIHDTTTPRPAAAIPPNAVGLAPAPPSPWFTTVDRPNADVAGGALARGGPTQMTALDLSGLFGGGQPAAAAPAAAAAQPTLKKKKIPIPVPRPKDTSIARARILRPDLYG